ncbi:MAG: protein kinase [Deltaproteobacteria bacterium]|nr:protein kinase [Deltaproteobacteria bacterium]
MRPAQHHARSASLPAPERQTFEAALRASALEEALLSDVPRSLTASLPRRMTTLPGATGGAAPAHIEGEAATPPPLPGAKRAKGASSPAPISARVAALPRLLHPQDDRPPELVLGEPLGQGGMGVVRRARQLALGREVAVKQVRADLRERGTAVHADAVAKLLDEALISGHLEHPDVLPVYALGQDEAGSPLLVMKRVEGTSWAEILQDDAHPALEGKEPIVWHLEVLMRVCRAVSYAHSRGVLHRDLKTENVMIGRFGEVYVLDWGIAVALGEGGSGALPLAIESREIVGTPSAMAPEMVMGNGALLSERTDVFLLGGILHEILTGAPRHQGRDVRALLWAAFECRPPTYAAFVPLELAAVAHRAGARLPEDRYPDADALRVALATFLEHRESMRLLDTARARVGQHAEAIETGRQALAEGVEAAQVEAERLRRRPPTRAEAIAAARRDPELQNRVLHVERLFAEGRLALTEALRAWPGNDDAERVRWQLVEAMVGWLAEIHEPVAAAGVAASLPDPHPALMGKIEQIAGEVRAYQRELERLRDDADASIGARTRTFLALVLGVGWFAFPLGGLWAQRTYGLTFSAADLVLSTVVFAAFMVAAVVWARETLFRSRLNRMVVAAGTACVLAVFGFRVIGWQMGLEFGRMLPIDLASFGLTVAMLAAIAWPRLWLSAVVFFTGASFAAAFPAHALAAVGVSNLLAMALIALAWRPSDYDEHPIVKALIWNPFGRR